MRNERIEVLLVGGHSVIGIVTEVQFDALMREMGQDSVGFVRVEDGTGYEIAIAYRYIAAVRYGMLGDEQEEKHATRRSTGL